MQRQSPAHNFFLPECGAMSATASRSCGADRATAGRCRGKVPAKRGMECGKMCQFVRGSTTKPFGTAFAKELELSGRE